MNQVLSKILIIGIAQGKIMMKTIGQVLNMTLMRIMMTKASTTVNQEVKTIQIHRNLERDLSMMTTATERGVKVTIDTVKRETKAINDKTSLERKHLKKQVIKCRRRQQETAS